MFSGAAHGMEKPIWLLLATGGSCPSQYAALRQIWRGEREPAQLFPARQTVGLDVDVAVVCEICNTIALTSSTVCRDCCPWLSRIEAIPVFPDLEISLDWVVWSNLELAPCSPTVRVKAPPALRQPHGI